MRSRFRLQLDVVLDTDMAPLVVAAARQHCARDTFTAEVPHDGRPPSAEEFIEDIEDALIELTEYNPLLANANVEFQRVTCEPGVAPELALIDAAAPGTAEASASGRNEDSLDADETEDDLEEFETGLYLCRWPNGEFSFVKADDRKNALVQLDEWVGAEPAWLIPVETCMLDFKLTDGGEIELAEFGEETEEFIWEECYPELSEVLGSEDASKHLSKKRKEQAAERIRQAVEHERTRLWHAQIPGRPARTALGRELQKRLGTVGPVADSYVEVAGKEILKSKKGDNGKPN